MAAVCQTPLVELNNLDLAPPSRRAPYGALLDCLPTSEDEDKDLNRDFPVDDLGIPLTIYVPSGFESKLGYNRHHHWAPRRELMRHHGKLGKLLRFCRIQIVPQELHNKYTRRYETTPLPATSIARFGVILLSTAGYLSAEAIDVRSDKHVRRELSLEERQAIWQGNLVRPERRKKIQQYILEHVIQCGVKDLSKSEIEEFVTTGVYERKIELGKKLFREAAEVASEPIALDYVRAWNEGLLPRQDLRQFSNSAAINRARAVPKSPRLFIDRHISNNGYPKNKGIEHLHTLLSQQVAA